MSNTLNIATEGLLQEDGQGGCRSNIIVKTDKARVVNSSSPKQTIQSKSSGQVTVLREQQQQIAPRQEQKTVLVSIPQQTIQVGANICLGSGTGGDSGDADLITPSRENGYLYPLTIGQPVCVVNNEWQPASSAMNRYEAVGLVVDSVILAGAAGRAQTTGMMTLQISEWDAVTDYVGGLVPEAPYYLGPSGKMTPIAPDSGALVRLGYALSSTQFSIDIESPILL